MEQITSKELIASISTLLDEKLVAREKNYAEVLFNTTVEAKRHNDKYEKGVYAIRFIKAAVLFQKDTMAGRTKFSMEEYQKDFLTKTYSNDSHFVGVVNKAIEQGNSGGFLIPEEYAQELIEFLYNGTVVKEMGATIVPMPKGSININKLIGTLVAQYVAEGGTADFSDIEIGRIKLVSKKLMALSSASNDLLRTNTWAADTIIRDSMIESMRVAMDYNLLYGTGGEDAPLGIANSAGIQTDTVGAVPTRSKLVEMLSKLGKKNINVNDASIGWVISFDAWENLYDERDAGMGPINMAEMDRGTLLGRKYMISNQVRTSGSTTDVFLGKWNEVYVGEEFDIDIAVDQSASFTDTNGKVVNAFTSDFTLFRGIMKHDMKLARGVAFIKYIFNVA